ncbi:hypothetical protein BG011_005346 [Mortierella polycephala]|uniref:Uncharacterized protein n=1 Tax=Mortierella polycephala TaxID=41804 RepID=A0A9P6PZ83_9FUNG|nr:hypothetical protein BG011_005346 [Mortierella polycephala]
MTKAHEGEEELLFHLLQLSASDLEPFPSLHLHQNRQQKRRSPNPHSAPIEGASSSFKNNPHSFAYEVAATKTLKREKSKPASPTWPPSPHSLSRFKDASSSSAQKSSIARGRAKSLSSEYDGGRAGNTVGHTTVRETLSARSMSDLLDLLSAVLSKAPEPLIPDHLLDSFSRLTVEQSFKVIAELLPPWNRAVLIMILDTTTSLQVHNAEDPFDACSMNSSHQPPVVGDVRENCHWHSDWTVSTAMLLSDWRHLLVERLATRIFGSLFTPVDGVQDSFMSDYYMPDSHYQRSADLISDHLAPDLRNEMEAHAVLVFQNLLRLYGQEQAHQSAFAVVSGEDTSSPSYLNVRERGSSASSRICCVPQHASSLSLPPWRTSACGSRGGGIRDSTRTGVYSPSVTTKMMHRKCHVQDGRVSPTRGFDDKNMTTAIEVPSIADMVSATTTTKGGSDPSASGCLQSNTPSSDEPHVSDTTEEHLALACKPHMISALMSQPTTIPQSTIEQPLLQMVRNSFDHGHSTSNLSAVPRRGMPRPDSVYSQRSTEFQEYQRAMVTSFPPRERYNYKMSYWQHRCRERARQRHGSISSIERLERPRSTIRTNPALSAKLADTATAITRLAKESNNAAAATDTTAGDGLHSNVGFDTTILPEAHSSGEPGMAPQKILSTPKLLDSSIPSPTSVQAEPTIPAPPPTQALSPQSPGSPTFGAFPLGSWTFQAVYEPDRYRRQILPTRPILNGISPPYPPPAANAIVASAGDNAEVTTHAKDTKKRPSPSTLETNQFPDLTKSTATTAMSPTTVTSFFTRAMTPPETNTPPVTPTPTQSPGASTIASANSVATGVLVSSAAVPHPLPCIGQSLHSKTILGLRPPQQEEAIATPVLKKGWRLWDRRLLVLKRRPFFIINSSNNDNNSIPISSACSSPGLNSNTPVTTSAAVSGFADAARSTRPATQSEKIAAATATATTTSKKATRREICDTTHVSKTLVNQAMIMTSPISVVTPMISLTNPSDSKRSITGGSHRGGGHGYSRSQDFNDGSILFPRSSNSSNHSNNANGGSGGSYNSLHSMRGNHLFNSGPDNNILNSMTTATATSTSVSDVQTSISTDFGCPIASMSFPRNYQSMFPLDSSVLLWSAPTPLQPASAPSSTSVSGSPLPQHCSAGNNSVNTGNNNNSGRDQCHSTDLSSFTAPSISAYHIMPSSPCSITTATSSVRKKKGIHEKLFGKKSNTGNSSGNNYNGAKTGTDAGAPESPNFPITSSSSLMSKMLSSPSLRDASFQGRQRPTFQSVQLLGGSTMCNSDALGAGTRTRTSTDCTHQFHHHLHGPQQYPYLQHSQHAYADDSPWLSCNTPCKANVTQEQAAGDYFIHDLNNDYDDSAEKKKKEKDSNEYIWRVMGQWQAWKEAHRECAAKY